MSESREQIWKKAHELKIQPFKSEFQPLSHGDIKRIERSFKYELPEDYKAFANEFGLGFFGVAVRVLTSNEERRFREFGYFMGTPVNKESWQYSGIRWVKECGIRLPKNCFPIATCETLQLFCMATSGWEKGSIFHYDLMEADAAVDDILDVPIRRVIDAPYMSYVANSFGEFIEKLEAFEPDWKPPKLPAPRKRKRKSPDSKENK